MRRASPQVYHLTGMILLKTKKMEHTSWVQIKRWWNSERQGLAASFLEVQLNSKWLGELTIQSNSMDQ